MKPLAKLGLVVAGVAAVALATSGYEASSSGATAELVTGDYGRKRWSIRRHGSQGYAYVVDGDELSAAATLRDAFTGVLGWLGERGSADDVVRFALVDRARSVVVQRDGDEWSFAIYRGSLVEEEGRASTRGAALIGALDALDDVLEEM